MSSAGVRHLLKNSNHEQLFLRCADNINVDPVLSKKTPVLLAQAAPKKPPNPVNSGPPVEIPSKWKEQAITILNDPCFCESVMSILSEEFRKKRVQVPDPKQTKQAFSETNKTVNKKVKWGPFLGLYKGKTKVDGRFDGYDNKKMDAIFLERNLLTDYGDRPNEIILTQSNHFIIFLHEALHKLIKEFDMRKEPISLTEEEDEHDLIRRILRRHFHNPLHQILSMELEEDIASEINEIRVACISMGHCARQSEQQTGGVNMAPPLIPPIHNGVDYNNDGISDSYVKADVCTTGTTEDGATYHAYAIDAGPLTPLLRGPPPNWVGIEFDEYKDCSVQPKEGAKMWSIRFLGRLDPYFTPYARFHNSKKTMSFLPWDKVYISNNDTPQVIQSFVLQVDEQTGKPMSPVYAQFDGCRLVELDQLSWATESAQRLDMNHVEGLLAGGNSSNSSPVEQQATQILKNIYASFGAQIAVANQLPEKDKEETLLKIRDAVVPLLRDVTTGEMKPPKNWENGALVLLDLPMQECSGLPCVLCCKSSENQPVKNNSSAQMIQLK